MLVEIPNELTEGIILKTENGFKVIDFNELTKELKDRISNLESELEIAKTQLRTLTQEDIPAIVKEYTHKFDNDTPKENLIRFMAYELLNDEINYDGIDYPANYDEIKQWVVNPTGDIPNGFEKYLKMITDDRKENNNE